VVGFQLESVCDGDGTIGEEFLSFDCHDLWRSNVMEEELYSVHNTRFCMNMNKEPKRQIFVDVAQEGVNHRYICVMCMNVFIAYGYI
jgi:hypothetical protein